MEWPCAGCSSVRFEGAVCPNISARITTRCIDSPQWKANLRVLEVIEIKTVPYAPLSHPFIERLIGTIRREYLDHILFWTTVDLEEKLVDFQHYYNGHRTHAGLEGRLPEPGSGQATLPLDLNSYRWRKHCRGLHETPIAA